MNRTFHHWATRLTNPKRGHDCPDGMWWEDPCWLGTRQLATRAINDLLRERGQSMAYRIWQDAGGTWQIERGAAMPTPN